MAFVHRAWAYWFVVTFDGILKFYTSVYLLLMTLSVEQVSWSGFMTSLQEKSIRPCLFGDILYFGSEGRTRKAVKDQNRAE